MQVRLLAPLAPVFALLLLAGCTSYQGSVLNSAELSTEGVREVILPDDAQVRQDGPAGRLVLSMEKSLEVEGSEAGFDDIDWRRHQMGVASRRDDNRLELATFGEFSDPVKGQARIRLSVRLSEGIAVTRSADHSGPNSIGNGNLKGWQKHVGD
jgi:hypothetical protein